MAFNMRIQEDGPRNAVLWIDGDVAPPTTPFITPAQLDYVDLSRKLRARNLRIDKIEWDINGEDSSWLELIWNGPNTAPNDQAPAYHMVGRANKYFKDFGGLYPPTNVVGANQSLTGITLTASASVPATYTVILYLVKTS